MRDLPVFVRCTKPIGPLEKGRIYCALYFVLQNGKPDLIFLDGLKGGYLASRFGACKPVSIDSLRLCLRVSS